MYGKEGHFREVSASGDFSEEAENPGAAPDAPYPDEEPVQQEETQEEEAQFGGGGFRV